MLKTLLHKIKAKTNKKKSCALQTSIFPMNNKPYGKVAMFFLCISRTVLLLKKTTFFEVNIVEFKSSKVRKFIYYLNDRKDFI